MIRQERANSNLILIPRNAIPISLIGRSERNLGFFELASLGTWVASRRSQRTANYPAGIFKGLSPMGNGQRFPSTEQGSGDVFRFGPRFASPGPVHRAFFLKSERKGRTKGKELGIQKYYGRGRFLVSKFGSLCATERRNRREGRETKHARRDWTQRKKWGGRGWQRL